MHVASVFPTIASEWLAASEDTFGFDKLATVFFPNGERWQGSWNRSPSPRSRPHACGPDLPPASGEGHPS